MTEAVDSTPVHLQLMQEQIVFVPLCSYTPLSHHEVMSGRLQLNYFQNKTKQKTEVWKKEVKHRADYTSRVKMQWKEIFGYILLLFISIYFVLMQI